MTWGVEDLTVRFGHKVALSGVSLELERGAVHVVVGGDGAGKTTLLRVIAGIGLDHEGTVRLPGTGKTGYVPPQGGVFGDLTVDENMEFVADAYRLTDWSARARALLERSAIAGFGDRLAGDLSGGQRRKLAGSMALLPEPDLLVLDEVTTGVDPVSRMDLWRLIAGAAADGAAVLVATSYLDEAERAGHVVLLHDGVVLAAGSPHDVRAAMTGSVADVAVPSDPATAWRHGRRWRQWDPAGTPTDNVTLEDVAIVAELKASGGQR
ncbi:MAG: ABC transporter ATP-binding protein [Acidimicrobiia bacterium]